MAFYDIFNGDADGLCALQQLRLDQPRHSRLITGTKRDITLLSRIEAAAGDELTVLDISMADNREALLSQLNAGARCSYFDHHFAGDIPVHHNLQAHITYAPRICTSLIVDAHLGGRFRAWAVVGACGDNLTVEAQRAAAPLQLPSEALQQLRALGECLNYNAYGDTIADLHFHPAELFRKLHRFTDPLQFIERDRTFGILRAAYEGDIALASEIGPLLDTSSHQLVVLPDAPWARRMHGPWANRLAEQHPNRAHAVLTQYASSYRVSVRAPVARPTGADRLCRAFPSGGGRPAAAGINDLPGERLSDFVSAFAAAFM